MRLLALVLTPVIAYNSIWEWTTSSLPGPRASVSYVPSACANGGRQGPPYAYACPHMAMLSDDMVMAAHYDGYGDDFVYAVAGGSSDSECGVCYQVQILQAEKHWRNDFPTLVVQIINSGFDVMSGQLDLFVGAGGMGYFTAVNSDCQYNHCNGGSCHEPGMYAGDFRAWTDAEFPDPHLCYEGGIKWFDDNEEHVWEACRNLSAGESALKDLILWDSCGRSNIQLLHQNFYETRYTRVACPEGLYRLTGLKRTDDDSYPRPSGGLYLDRGCGGSISQGRTCISTMHDGCVPSCAWQGKVATAPGYTCVDRCGRDGIILH